MITDPKVQKIIDWRNSLTSLEAEYFFELVHVYLGEIKTPFNKQDLIEKLSSFLRNKENKEKILCLLTEEDLKILYAIKTIKNVTPRKIQNFFYGEFSSAKVFALIASLEERLLIYKFQEEIKINPMMEDEILPLLSAEILVPEYSDKEIIPDKKTELELTPEVFAFFIWYVSCHKDLCKNNGELKKKSASELSEIFRTDCKEFFEYLVKATVNLGILTDIEGKIQVEFNVLEQFAQNTFTIQKAWLCSASAAHLSKNAILNNAKLFLQLMETVRGKNYTLNSLSKIAYIIKETDSSDFSSGTSRFARILSQRTNSQNDNDSLDTGLIEMILMAAVKWNLIICDKDSVCHIPENFDQEFTSESKKLLNIDTGFSANLMKGLEVRDLIKLIKILDVVSWDIVSTLEISKSSINRAFNLKLSKEEIKETLEEFAIHSLSKTLLVSIDDWDSYFNCASLYKGYVIQLASDKIKLAENNPGFSKHILKTFCPGVYLLDFTTDEEAQNSISKLGLDLTLIVQKPAEEKDESYFSSIKVFASDIFNGTSKWKPDPEKQNQLKNELLDELSKLTLSSEQKEGLEDRINRRVILTPEQLRPESVKFELLEASGMDYTRKIHVIERAIQQNCLAEIEMSGKEKILGRPAELTKSGDIQWLEIATEEGTKKVQVSQISYIKRFRKSVFG